MERRVAKALGGVRLWRPDFGDSIPDGESATFIWDAKCYARHAAVSMFVENEEKYRRYGAGRRFLLVLFSRDRPRQGDFVLLRMSDFQALARAAGELPRADFRCGQHTPRCAEQCSRCRVEFG